MPGLKGSGVAE